MSQTRRLAAILAADVNGKMLGIARRVGSARALKSLSDVTGIIHNSQIMDL
jgi:hypothetical protein